MTKILKIFYNYLRNIKYSKSIKFIFVKYNFVLIKRINDFIAARKIILHNGIIFSITKNIFVSHSFRPFKAKDVKIKTIESSKTEDCCIIIQGPIITENDFTFETIKLYLRLHPRTPIVLSTWSDTKKETVSLFEKLKIKLILNEKPKTPGWSNINYQIFSTASGIKFAKKMGLKYIVKTRTDCRIYSSNFLLYCKTLINKFPSSIPNRKRIISTDFSTKHIAYGLSDIFQFGAIEEMELFWKYIPWEEEIKQKFSNNKIINDTPVVCEFFLTSRYLKELKVFEEWNLNSWWLSLKNNFMIIDNNSIDLFFNKYDYFFEQRFSRAYGSEHQKSISHTDWILLYSGEISKWDYEDNNTIQKWRITDKGEIIKKK